MSAPRRVGVIGLGNMGRPMGRNLVLSGFAVSGFDISARAVAAAASDGIERGGSPAAMGRECDLVLIMVWDDEALRKVVFGPGGLLQSASLRAGVVDLSTTSVALAREVGQALAASGGTFLDGAVIGGGVGAVRAGKSPIVLAGDRKAYDRCLPVLAPLGTCDYVGAQGNAKAVKILNNLLVGIVTAANAEALSLGVALGLDLGNLVHWLHEGPGDSRVLASYMGRYVGEGIYGEGLIGHRLMAKDLRLAAELAESVGCPTVYPRLGEQMYLTFGRAVGHDRPFPSAYEYFRSMAGAPNCLRQATASQAS